MNFEQQRMFAGILAEEANAPMTLAALRDPETCFEGILTTAFAEIGADRLVAYLQRGDAMWSYQALRCLPALEAYRSVLLKKAAESPNAAVHALRFIDDLGDHEPALRASAAELFNSVDTIDKFEFDNDGVYVAYFAMKWVNNGTTYQVTREAGPSGLRDSPWPVGGGALFKGDYDKVGCADFSRASGSPSRPATRSGSWHRPKRAIARRRRCASRTSRMRVVAPNSSPLARCAASASIMAVPGQLNLGRPLVGLERVSPVQGVLFGKTGPT